MDKKQFEKMLAESTKRGKEAKRAMRKRTMSERELKQAAEKRRIRQSRNR